MKLTELFEEISPEISVANRFPVKHGPFQSKNNIYDWMKRMRGDKGHKGSLYFGSGPQKNVLKGGGGGQDAWLGYIKRTPEGVYFFGKEEYPFEPEIGKLQREEPPIRPTDILGFIKAGTPEDEIIKYTIERGISNGLARILKDPQSPEYQQLSAHDEGLLMMEIGSAHNIEPIEPNIPKPEFRQSMGLYGVDMDNFYASVLDGKDDEELANLFNISPNQAQSLRVKIGYKHKPGREREYNYDDIERMFNSGMTDDQIEAQVGASHSTISQITNPLKAQKVEELHRAGKSVDYIADKLGLNAKAVGKYISNYEKRQKTLQYCKKHKIKFNPNFGCPQCKAEAED